MHVNELLTCVSRLHEHVMRGSLSLQQLLQCLERLSLQQLLLLPRHHTKPDFEHQVRLNPRIGWACGLLGGG